MYIHCRWPGCVGSTSAESLAENVVVPPQVGHLGMAVDLLRPERGSAGQGPEAAVQRSRTRAGDAGACSSIAGRAAAQAAWEQGALPPLMHAQLPAMAAQQRSVHGRFAMGMHRCAPSSPPAHSLHNVAEHLLRHKPVDVHGVANQRHLRMGQCVRTVEELTQRQRQRCRDGSNLMCLQHCPVRPLRWPHAPHTPLPAALRPPPAPTVPSSSSSPSMAMPCRNSVMDSLQRMGSSGFEAAAQGHQLA